MKLRRRTTGILVVAVAVIIIAPLTAYHYLDPSMNQVPISVQDGNAQYNFSGNYNTTMGLFSPNYKSIGYAMENNGNNSTLTLRSNLRASWSYEPPPQSYYTVQMNVTITGNLSGNLDPTSISLYSAMNGTMVNTTSVYGGSYYFVAPIVPADRENNVSYNIQNQFAFRGVGNETQTIKLLNQESALKNSTRYHFMYTTGIQYNLYQIGMTYGNLLNTTLIVTVNGLSSPLSSKMAISFYNSG